MCKSENYKLTSLDDVVSNTEYLGDASTANWVSSGTVVPYAGDSLLLTLAQGTVGTLLMSTHYVWYGKISATMSTSQGQGVVTAFILMSDVKDEIDWEFVGADVDIAQSNFYWQGVTEYTNGFNISTTDTWQNSHTYTFDWQPDYMSWAIDGVVGRTVYKNETFNTTDNKYHYPQTPARVQLSLWPAGLPTNGQGTIDWAGGLIDWSSPYMQNGYYYAVVEEVSVECYSPPSSVEQNGNQAYYYTNSEGLQSDVAIGNNKTILGSLFASGDDPDYNPDKTASGAQATQQTVPGLNGIGNQGLQGQTGAESAAAPSASSDFVQGNESSSKASTVVAGSIVALLGFVAAALML